MFYTSLVDIQQTLINLNVSIINSLNQNDKDFEGRICAILYQSLEYFNGATVVIKNSPMTHLEVTQTLDLLELSINQSFYKDRINKMKVIDHVMKILYNKISK